MNQIELSDFIKSTLVDVAKGVKGANHKIQEEEGRNSNYFTLRSNRGDNSKIPGIMFDIAVTASKNQKDKAGFMVALATLGAGANTEKGMGSEVVHRIKFEVGLYYDYS